MAGFALQLGCQRGPSGAPRLPGGATPAVASRPHAVAVPSEAEPIALIPAARCGECHGQIESEWRKSAHAQAESSPTYQRMRALAQTAAKASECDVCHTPLRRFAPTDRVNDEGVSCDGCHTLSSMTIGGGQGLAFRPDDNVRFGPLCDAQPHYFHRMGCAPWFRESQFCAACHDALRHLPAVAGPPTSLFPEYSEWRDEYSAQGSQDCQACHMPATRREVAVGSAERIGIREHTFRLHDRLLGRALSGQAQVTSRGGSLHVVVTLLNSGAGHAVPTGLPERRLQIGVELFDAAGHVTAHQEHSRGRVLVDPGGTEAPFFAAARVDHDNRIRPGQTETDVFDLPPAGGSRLSIFVRRRPIALGIWQKLGGAPPSDEPMLHGELVLPAGWMSNNVPSKTAAEPIHVRLGP
ncbi:MAG TPA: multiheme c-type cytochrome [Pseudomonadota bacterium]|nr:multiheme c-type cytochrome [Pseudomonadota bacterium]